MNRIVTVIAALVLATLTVWGSRSAAVVISACGIVDRSEGCLIMWDLLEGEAFVLPDSLDLACPGEYHITGEFYSEATSCGILYPWRLRDVVVTSCVPETLGCGRIRMFHVDDDCYFWESLQSGERYLLDGLQGYSAGDTVVASGLRCPSCPGVPGTCFDFGIPVLQMRLSECADSLNPAMEQTWGRIKARYRR